MHDLMRIELQQGNEERYNRKHIDAKLRAFILGSIEGKAKIYEGVALLQQWLNGQYYASKMARLEQLKLLDLEQLVLELFVGMAYCLKPVLYTSITAQLASRLKMDDKPAAIQTLAEVMAVLCATDVFDISKANASASLMLHSNITLPDELVEFILHSEYLPPMVCEPKELQSNYDSGYLTHTDSLILGKGNHHDGDICLDVLNLINRVPLKLDTQFLSTFEEMPNEITVEKMKKNALKKGDIIDDAEAKARVQKALDNWKDFKLQSYRFYDLMVQQGNRFWITNKVDKRGRIYSSGFHINPQGASFKKAMIEFANEEIVTGVPI